jgi:hypothetical protein
MFLVLERKGKKSMKVQTKHILLCIAICFLLLPFQGMGVAQAANSSAPAPPGSDPACYDTGCDHTNPYNTHCNQGAILRGRDVQRDDQGNVGGEVQMWFSPRCDTYWSSVTTTLPPAKASPHFTPCPATDVVLTQAYLYDRMHTDESHQHPLMSISPGGSEGPIDGDPGAPPAAWHLWRLSDAIIGNTSAHSPQLLSVVFPLKAEGQVSTCAGENYLGHVTLVV